METLAVFPVSSVLFPGSRLALKVFEQRYLDLVKTCLRDNQLFISVALLSGHEVLPKGVKHIPEISPLGVSAKIVDFDMDDASCLNIIIEGQHVYELADLKSEESGLLRATVSPYLNGGQVAVESVDYEVLYDLALGLQRHPSLRALNLVLNPAKPEAVCGFLAQYLPMENTTRLKLLAMSNLDGQAAYLQALLGRMQ